MVVSGIVRNCWNWLWGGVAKEDTSAWCDADGVGATAEEGGG